MLGSIIGWILVGLLIAAFVITGVLIFRFFKLDW